MTSTRIQRSGWERMSIGPGGECKRKKPCLEVYRACTSWLRLLDARAEAMRDGAVAEVMSRPWWRFPPKSVSEAKEYLKRSHFDNDWKRASLLRKSDSALRILDLRDLATELITSDNKEMYVDWCQASILGDLLKREEPRGVQVQNLPTNSCTDPTCACRLYVGSNGVSTQSIVGQETRCKTCSNEPKKGSGNEFSDKPVPWAW